MKMFPLPKEGAEMVSFGGLRVEFCSIRSTIPPHVRLISYWL